MIERAIDGSAIGGDGIMFDSPCSMDVGSLAVGHFGQAAVSVVSTFQTAIMFQPVSGYVLDVVGLKVGFALFAIAWSCISMAHALAYSWQSLAALRGLHEIGNHPIHRHDF